MKNITVSRSSLLKIVYETLCRLWDKIYYQPNNGLSEKTESIQHNAELAITTATY